MAVQHLDMEKGFLRTLLNDLPKPMTNELATGECLRALVKRVWEYLLFLPESQSWPQRLAECVGTIELIIGEYEAGRSIQWEMGRADLNFRCSPIFRAELVLVRAE